MNPIRSSTRRSIFALALLSLSGCAGMGLGQTLGGLGLPGTEREVRGQVRSVNGRAREIQIQSSNGRNVLLEYDSRTQVVFQNRQYAPSNLERGDYVRARVQQGDRRRPYADRIVVERSARNSRGGNDNRDVYRDNGRGNARDLQRFDGRVARVDHNRGYFQLQQSRGRSYTVVMPYRPRNADLKNFRRLRNGQRVRFDGAFLSRDRIELQRFR